MVDFFEYDASSEGEVSSRAVRGGNWILTGSLGRNALEDVVDKGVEDGHRLVGDTSVGMDLLKDYMRERRMSTKFGALRLNGRTLVDVRGVSLLAPLPALLLLAVSSSAARRLRGLLRCLSTTLRGSLRRGLRRGRGGCLSGSGRGLGGHC